MKKKEYILHNIAAKYILGEDVSVELSGKGPELELLHNLLIVSKELKESLDNGKDISIISSLLEEKKILTKKFEEISNITWRL
jgi:hypothetical protein